MADNKFLVDFNLNQNELQNVVIQNLATAPSNPKEGQIYFNTTDHTLYVYVNNAWADALSQGMIYNEGTGIDITGATISIDDTVVATKTFTGSTYVPLTREINGQALNSDITLDADDVGAVPTTRTVNGKALSSDIVLDASDVNALPDTTTINDLTTTAQQNALNSGIDSTKVTQITTNQTDISTINSKIPSQATSTNQLADKDFVNSSVGTNTADYISNNGQPFTSLAELEAYTGTVTNNDYAFVVTTDAAGNTVYNRYKYSTATTPASWAFEYALNNSSFTANQWAAINSGATSTNIAQIATNASDISALQTIVAGKQDIIDDLGTIRSNAQAGKNASDTIATYGNIVTHNVSEFATAAQGAKADTACQKITVTNPALTPTGGVCTWTITNTLATADITVCMYEVSTNQQVYSQVTTSSSTVVIKMNSTSNIAAGTYKAVIVGQRMSANSRFLNLDTDGTLSANSDTIVPSQKAIKTYVDNHSGGITWGNITGTLSNQTDLQSELNKKFELPSQTGQSGKFLTTDGTDASWGDINIPDNVYTSDNLVAGTNISIDQVQSSGGIDNSTLALFHLNGDLQDSSPYASTIYDPETAVPRTGTFADGKWNQQALVTTSGRCSWANTANAWSSNMSASGITLDFWFYIDSNNNDSGYNIVVFDGEMGVAINIQIGTDTGLKFYINGDNISANIPDFTTNTWYHCAVTSNMDIGRDVVYINGKAVYRTLNSVDYTNGISRFIFGNLGGLIRYQEMRLSAGVLYDGDFTPPTAPYRADPIQQNVINCTLDVSSKTANAVLDQSDGITAIKTWTGTQDGYDAIATKDNDTLYYTPENIIPNKAIYVVYEWKQGKDWCRVWSDGWCEQGGYCPQSGGTLTSPVTVNLHREMRDTNYTILFTRTAATTTQNVTGHVGSAVDWTTTSFTYAFTGGSGHCMWEVKGYCAEVPNAGSSVVSWAEAADRNLSNLTTTGKIVGAGLAMPSDRYINLTLGASETTYTAPANGWFLLYFHTTTSGDRWAQLVNESKNDFVNRITTNIASDFSICLPVNKGDIVLLQYANINLAYSWNKFRFYYAVGSESEAN